MALAKTQTSAEGCDDPEALLNEWLGELTALTAGLDTSNDIASLKPLEIVAPRIDTYRFSMANLEETQDADLDAILGELCGLDSECDEELSRMSATYSPPAKEKRPGGSASCPQRQDKGNVTDPQMRISRTDSPDNDSAFSDTVSMLSSESSASSSASAKCKTIKLKTDSQKDANFQQKADKIKLALERMKEAIIKKLFIKAFSADGSSKSLLVDEKMTCGYVTRLLADKNHVTMEPKWAIVEHLPDLHMERIYEDHEMLVDNLMMWTRESKNKILFVERPEKISLFQTPERYLLPEDEKGGSNDHDEHSRQVIIEEFFGQNGNTGSSVPSVSGHPVPHIEGPLYLKSDVKKGWKKYHFVLRPSGLYYSPKDRVKTLKELVCLATFDTNEVYVGLNWKKKYKSPTDFCFAIKHPRLQQPKSVKFIKFLCADDQRTLDRWLTAMRIAKHGRQLLENYRILVEELSQDDLDHLAHARSCSITSIPTKSTGASIINSPIQPTPGNVSAVNSDISSGRHSRASSSSSSGCMSDGGTTSESTFDCEFPMGTIKRKPSMKPNIPLTWTTRQLKEMAEAEGANDASQGSDSGTLTRRQRTDDSTLTRHRSIDSTDSSVYNTIGKQPPASPSQHYNHYETIQYRNKENSNALYAYADAYVKGTAEDLPLPPPPTEDVGEGMFSSCLSLDSLPPPPPETEDILGSQLSLPPPPPEGLEQGRVQEMISILKDSGPIQPKLAGRPFPRQPSLDSVTSSASKTSSDRSIQSGIYGACIVEMQGKKLASPLALKKGSIKKVNFADEPADKKQKKITFNLAESPQSPRKPPPPKRNESTRLSSPKKLVDSTSNPPKDFLKDLQRVMRKKWQVAQKCKLEPTTTPHEVLGFREYPLSEDYKEASVSIWVQEHYGNYEDPFYENLADGRAAPKREEPKPFKKRPPPPPPKRSDSTHLTTHPAVVPPTA